MKEKGGDGGTAGDECVGSRDGYLGRPKGACIWGLMRLFPQVQEMRSMRLKAYHQGVQSSCIPTSTLGKMYNSERTKKNIVWIILIGKQNQLRQQLRKRRTIGWHEILITNKNISPIRSCPLFKKNESCKNM